MRKSRILDQMERFVGRIWGAAASSLILSSLASVYPKTERLFRRGCFRRLSDEETDRDAWQFRFRCHFRRAMEESLLLRTGKRLARTLLQTTVGSYAVLFTLYGVLSFLLRIYFTTGMPSLRQMMMPSLLTVASLPLTRITTSLGYAVRQSRILGRLWFEPCEFPRSILVGRERGRSRYGVAVLLAVVLVLVSRWIPFDAFWGVFLITLGIFFIVTLPEIGVLAVLIAFPFLHWLPHPTLILAAISLLSELAWLFKALAGRRALSFGVIDLIVLLFGACYATAGLTGMGGKRAALNGFLMAIMIFFWFPVRNLLSQKVWRVRAVDGIQLAGLACAGLGIWEYFFTRLELRWVDVSRFSDIGGRVTSTFSNPNILAVYLLLIAPICLAGALDRTRRRRCRNRSFLAFCGVFCCIVLTWTRGAWLGVLLSLPILLLLFSRRTACIFALFCLPLSASLPYLPASIRNRFASIGSLTESSIRYRLYTWQGVRILLEEHRWGIGVGTEAFERIYPSFAVSGTETVMHTHHLILQILTELGVSGGCVFAFFLLLLFFCVGYGLRTLHGNARAVALGGACGIFGTMILGMFDYIWYQTGMLLFFFSICAVTVSAVESSFAGENGVVIGRM